MIGECKRKGIELMILCKESHSGKRVKTVTVKSLESKTEVDVSVSNIIDYVLKVLSSKTPTNNRRSETTTPTLSTSQPNTRNTRKQDQSTQNPKQESLTTNHLDVELLGSSKSDKGSKEKRKIALACSYKLRKSPSVKYTHPQNRSAASLPTRMDTSKWQPRICH